MRASTLRSRLLALIALTLGFGTAAAMLPDDPYQRWQLLDGTIHKRSRWIYERVHFDPTPIDVAIVGPSRFEAGVNAIELQRELANRGVRANVVNFSLPENGRNLNAVIVDELLKTKRPKLLVVGVIEKPSRYGHSAYKYVAPAAAIVDLGYLGNINYFSDLIYLPFRQLKLFAAHYLPGMVGVDADFEPGRYAGPVLDTTGDKLLPDGTVKNGSQPASAAELDRGVRKLEAGTTPPLLPARYADIEFGDERHYLRHIAERARANGVQIIFLSLPYHTGPSDLQEATFYGHYGTIWKASALANRSELFADYGHLTSHGALILTRSLAQPMADLLRTKS